MPCEWSTGLPKGDQYTLTFIGAGGEHDEGTGLYFEQGMNPGSHHIKITNLQRGSLIIHQDGTDTELDPHQTHIYNVKGNNEHNKDVDLNVVVYGNGTAVIPGAIIGDYTVTQVDPWSWRYSNAQPPQSVQNTEFERRAGGYVKEFAFTDIREQIYWLDGNSWCRNMLDTTTVTATRLPEN